jgi:hypothetical protein
MLRRAGAEGGQAAVALAASSSLQIGTTLALPLLALPAIVAGTPVDRSLATSAYLGAVVLALLIGAGLLAFTSDRPLALGGRGLEWVLNRTIRRWRKITDLPQKLLAERDFVRTTIGRRWKAALLAAAGNTGFDYLALLCALRAVGAQPRPSLVVLAYTGAELLALIPLTPGGLGFVEAGLAGTLTLAGVSHRTRCSRPLPTGSSRTGSRSRPKAWRTSPSGAESRRPPKRRPRISEPYRTAGRTRRTKKIQTEGSGETMEQSVLLERLSHIPKETNPALLEHAQ